MPLYLVRLEGRNVLVEDLQSREKKRMGFFASRLVDATSEQDALEKSKSLVKQELADQAVLQDPVRPLQLIVEEIVRADESTARAPSRGFTFYPDLDQ